MTNNRVPFVTLDVFTAKGFEGNPLAVVETTHNEVSSQKMQTIAREFNFSETVFLDRRDVSHPRIRIFTPVNEMALAGHPLIGTGHVLFRRLLPNAGDPTTTVQKKMSVETKAGMVAIEYNSDTMSVAADIPHNVHIHSHHTPKDRILHTQPALLADEASAGMKQEFPTVSIVCGVTYVLVDLTDLSDLFAAVSAGNSPIIDLDDGWGPSFAGTMFYKLLAVENDKNTVVHNLQVRMVAIGLEDPACGSGCCSLAAYLALQDGKQGGKYRFDFNQGSEMGRNSNLRVDILLNNEGNEVATVQLSGQGAPVAEGTIILP
ncbi:hypothetical protein FSARC_7755 [Fusarium sarcochroum]|uniref:Phenazine biosynthesis protein n=1 Tax=Fusarium sarcochroum TaxID=1208366 RepID=A0A8H4X7N8_9HYPO|nr:hypothetical protein FSARC_7755 [Fusarium sarcochroum]